MGPGGSPTRLAKLASSQKRVLRGGKVLGQPRPRSVDSECIGRVIEPRKRICRGSRRCRLNGRPCPRAAIGLVRGFHRGRRAGHVHRGSPRNLGGPVVSANGAVVGEATTQITLAWKGGADLPRRNEQQSTGRYRQPKETKRGGMNGRASEQLVVAMKAGNRSEEPVGAKGLPDHGIVQGTDHGCI